MTTASLYDPLTGDEWDVDEIPAYFPDLRVKGAALYDTLDSPTIDKACLLMMRDLYREALRCRLPGFPADPRLKRERGAPAKSVLQLFCDAGLQTKPARKAAAILAGCLTGLGSTPNDDSVRWVELTDRLLSVRMQLRVEGESRPTVLHVKERFEAQRSKAGNWPLPTSGDWAEVMKLGLHTKSITELLKGRRQTFAKSLKLRRQPGQ